MKYVSMDIETTGLNPETCDVIEVAAVIDDLSNVQPVDSLPKFQTYVFQENYRGEPYALSMHAEVFKKLARCTNYDLIITYRDNVIGDFLKFLRKNGVDEINWTVAGKNYYSFDHNFLVKLPEGDKLRPHRRALDPSVLYFDHKFDDVLPSTEECIKRAGLKDTMDHTALKDAMRVVELLRFKFL